MSPNPADKGIVATAMGLSFTYQYVARPGLRPRLARSVYRAQGSGAWSEGRDSRASEPARATKGYPPPPRAEPRSG